MRDARGARYVSWIERHTMAILLASALLVATSAYLITFHLPVRAAFTYLLPSDAPSVRAFDELASRLPVRDRMLMVIVAPDPETRVAAGDQAIAAARAISPDLIERLDTDDAETRSFLRAHRYLYAPVEDLTAARDALATELAAARRRANPLYVDLDDEPVAHPALDALRRKQRDADARLAHSPFVGDGGRAQVIVISTAFAATDVDRDYRLQRELDDIAGQVHARHPAVQIGFTGGITTTVAEHHALLRGMLLSTLITSVLVALVLIIHLRSLRLLALVGANITAATVIAFGVAALTVGHLNAATAFLGAIIAGNGVNYGILLVARFSDERRTAAVSTAMARAIAGTLRPTLVASLGAAIAYGALGVTKFRGFADFALIGGAGMIVCWIASFVVLPALLLRFARTWRRTTSPLFGRVVAPLVELRPVAVCAGAAVVVLFAGAVAWHYLAHDPYEYDMTQLRSQAPDARAARDWLRYADHTFERGQAGIAGQTYVVVNDAHDVTPAVAELRAIAAREPLVGQISSIDDAIPPDQAARIALLAEIRTQIDTIAPELDTAKRDEVLAVRPPDSLIPLTVADLPRELATKLRERDGSIGRLISVRPGPRFDEYDGRDLIRFSAAVRKLRGPTVAGAPMLFADVLLQIQHDGPLVTLVAAIGLAVMVVLVVGRNRRAVAVLVATAGGSLAMIAVCALAGLRVNFLDFVALPITLGIGIDYAVNLAERGTGDRAALRATGGTVLVCSLTTMIGYTSLLVSDNLAIRGFGLASLVGEITCVVAALVIVPAVLAVRLVGPRRWRVRSVVLNVRR